MIAPQGRCHGPDTSACLLLLSCVLNFKKMEVEVWMLIIVSSHWQEACPWKNRNTGCLKVSTRETGREMGQEEPPRHYYRKAGTMKSCEPEIQQEMEKKER